MSGKNLSVELFKPRFKHPETSSLVRLRRHATHEVHSATWMATAGAAGIGCLIS